MLQAWLSSSSMRLFPHCPAGRRRSLRLDSALNETTSCQVGLRLAGVPSSRIHLEIDAEPVLQVRVRRVGLVPVLHRNTSPGAGALDVDGVGAIPGYVPDPLYDEDSMLLSENETHAFWLTISPFASARPGETRIRVRVEAEPGGSTELVVGLHLHEVELKPRRNFHVTHWFYADALIDWYKTRLFDRRFWSLAEAYMRDMVLHGQDTVYVPVFTPPLDGVKRPTQLLRITKKDADQYQFDWSDVRTYVRLARRCGIRRFEWCHPFTQWGASNAIRIYEGQGDDEALLWPPSTGAVSGTYRDFLARYLSSLHRFLKDEGLLRTSFFHVSDEPHGEEHLQNYKRAREMLRELAPWMRVMDALSEVAFARQGLTDMPIPSIATSLDFIHAGIPCWCYYCCGPRGPYLNHLLDTPLPKIAMHGFLFYRWPFKGFLHWGYNYWYRRATRELIDPTTVQDGGAWETGWAYGDTFLVYPGPRGPVDSIRWEIFAEAMQDYRLLQTREVSRDASCLRGIRSFKAFPKTATWRSSLRRRLLEGGAP